MGNELFNTVIEATDLPNESMTKELAKILTKHGVSPDTMTMEDLRMVLADYLQDTILEAKEAFR